MKKKLLMMFILSASIMVSVKGFTGDIKFRSPISASYSFSAYYDNDASSAIKDYKCGTNTYNAHGGTDFAAPRYTPIYSAASGNVIYSENGLGDGCKTCCVGKGCLGNQVRIDHGSSWQTYYGHMQKGTAIAPYVCIKCGTKIGEVGTSGQSSGCHLHFHVVKYGYPKDDPFAGQCSGSQSFWTAVINGKPTTQCSY